MNPDHLNHTGQQDPQDWQDWQDWQPASRWDSQPSLLPHAQYTPFSAAYPTPMAGAEQTSTGVFLDSPPFPYVETGASQSQLHYHSAQRGMIGSTISTPHPSSASSRNEGSAPLAPPTQLRWVTNNGSSQAKQKRTDHA